MNTVALSFVEQASGARLPLVARIQVMHCIEADSGKLEEKAAEGAKALIYRGILEVLRVVAELTLKMNRVPGGLWLHRTLLPERRIYPA